MIHAGELLIEKQRESGVRPILDALDSLRMTLGSEAVLNMTPKAEVRMRSGSQAQIPLKAQVNLDINDMTIVMSITFCKGYPDEALEIEFIENESLSTEKFNFIQENVNNYSHLPRGGKYPTILDVVNYCKSLIVISEDESPTSSGLNVGCDTVDYSGTCRLCRAHLFDSNDLTEHSKDSSRRCTSTFLSNQPSWLLSDGSLEGKLYCPKCNSRVGQWSWIGGKCSCGDWFAPAFQFTTSKIDKKIVCK